MAAVLRTNARRRTCGDIIEFSSKGTFKDHPSEDLPPTPQSINALQKSKKKPKKTEPVLLGARTTNFNGDEPTVIEWKNANSEMIAMLNTKVKGKGHYSTGF